MGDITIPTDSSGTPLPASLQGYFLISETELADPNFRQTVVLLVNHNEEGAFGLVVNRPADLSLGDVVTEFEGQPIGEAPTFVGGPVEQLPVCTPLRVSSVRHERVFDDADRGHHVRAGVPGNGDVLPRRVAEYPAGIAAACRFLSWVRGLGTRPAGR